MVQTRIEEKMESFNQEIIGIKKELIREATAGHIVIYGSKREGAMISEHMTELALRESSAAKLKGNKATSSREIGETSTERKADTDEISGDRSKFKVEMSVFTSNDPDSWLFRA
ncbi:histone-lysine N-methyltransferase ASHR1 isoform X3 [Cucumis melo var. makuwa]|uniref:Histone-lysine N-methyltransferase ASHR1 isoform X3 n=1 Tax=Cucumis melo var. makuwa TaxID=1194695 RepID=A0A5D3DYL0_CUCMM|nr:histone-lysine N-methyltransferase ASHR1 isoform X3 [Cucumis melo var. makuwa]